ncbi:SEC-C motif-containing protein [Hathewaya proteolytica DSM 3090]|uniref:SEC-C motif-containing protein n=1 Tax=Hathewaya proteolytica DSM 3090 TaxID=1121331 RepID=A0A1M6MTE4_9CLOT|nr:SEC-C metal-binding domain-containing protein [Hathewaya proteolytica]SHJ86788.1 SEC-C motif-containing protein [Hathewaya proteolytica DSM 3090]
MSLYKEWNDYVVDVVKNKGENVFWDTFGKVETGFYKKVLGEQITSLQGTVEELASKFDVDAIQFMGLIDGISDSLNEELDLENMERDTKLDVHIDYEKLYFNMLDSKADYLYTLPQWDAIFSVDKRKSIQKDYRDSKTVVKEVRIGRNDPCPCGSGKKYKKCCGK